MDYYEEWTQEERDAHRVTKWLKTKPEAVDCMRHYEDNGKPYFVQLVNGKYAGFSVDALLVQSL